jgi:hypothetical protein
MKGKDRTKAMLSGWRELNPSDRTEAHRLRHVLGAMGHYPPGNNPDVRQAVERKRVLYLAYMTEIVCELDILDLATLYNVARCLAVIPRERGLFRRLKSKQAITLRPVA